MVQRMVTHRREELVRHVGSQIQETPRGANTPNPANGRDVLRRKPLTMRDECQMVGNEEI